VRSTVFVDAVGVTTMDSDVDAVGVTTMDSDDVVYGRLSDLCAATSDTAATSICCQLSALPYRDVFRASAAYLQSETVSWSAATLLLEVMVTALRRWDEARAKPPKSLIYEDALVTICETARRCWMEDRGPVLHALMSLSSLSTFDPDETAAGPATACAALLLVWPAGVTTMSADVPAVLAPLFDGAGMAVAFARSAVLSRALAGGVLAGPSTAAPVHVADRASVKPLRRADASCCVQSLLANAAWLCEDAVLCDEEEEEGEAAAADDVSTRDEFADPSAVASAACARRHVCTLGLSRCGACGAPVPGAGSRLLSFLRAAAAAASRSPGGHPLLDSPSSSPSHRLRISLCQLLAAAPTSPVAWPCGVLSPSWRLRLLLPPITTLLLAHASFALRGDLTGLGPGAGEEGEGDAALGGCPSADPSHSPHATALRMLSEEATAALRQLLHGCLAARAQVREGGPLLGSSSCAAANTRQRPPPPPPTFDELQMVGAATALLRAATPLQSQPPRHPTRCAAAEQLRARSGPFLHEPSGEAVLLQALLLLAIHAPAQATRALTHSCFSTLLPLYADWPRFHLLAQLLRLLEGGAGWALAGAQSLSVAAAASNPVAAAADSIAGNLSSSPQVHGAVLDAFRSGLAAALAEPKSAVAKAAAAPPAACTASGTPASALPPSTAGSAFLSAAAGAVLLDAVDARIAAGLTKRPWTAAAAAAVSAAAVSGAISLPPPESVAEEAAALVERGDEDRALLATFRLLLLHAAQGPGVTRAGEAVDSGTAADSAVVQCALPVLRVLVGEERNLARLRDCYVRPLAAAVHAVQGEYRRQVGAVELTPHASPFLAVQAPVARGGPESSGAEKAVAAVPAALAAVSTVVPARHRSEDDALLSRLALLDSALAPVLELLQRHQEQAGSGVDRRLGPSP